MKFDTTTTESENILLFHKLFEKGHILFDKQYSDSWKKSSLYYIKHPTSEQLYEEAMRIHNNLKSLIRSNDKNAESVPPKLEDFVENNLEDETKPYEEFVEILGLCLWDIFSENHEVIAANGKIHDIGSFRGAAGFIANYINTHIKGIDINYDYVDFYLGSAYISTRADLTPLYEEIFKGLKSAGCNWKYSFPKMQIIDLANFPNSPKFENQNDFLNYDPEKSILEELEIKQQKEKIEKLRETFEKDYREAVKRSKHEPLPRTVLAYKIVYKQLPDGWPHK